MKKLSVFLITVLLYVGFANSSILDRLKDDPDLSQFYSMLERDPVANSTINLRSCTLFVPTNQAFQKHQGNASVLYHMATIALNKDQLQKTVPSDMDGNPPIYVTRTHHGDIFINNAKLIPSRSVEERNMFNKRQVMHVIDDVLVPLTPNAHSKIDLANPDAYQFLNQADSLNIGSHRLRVYRGQVVLMKKELLYQSPGRHTFLIPVDESFKTTTRSNLIDNKVIDGHVIPNNVIFTSAANEQQQLTSAAFSDNLKVTVTFFTERNGKVHVRSNTMAGDAKHPTGAAIAEIVKANIPVANGVVHLIDRPLMIVDTTVKQFLMSYKDKENSALNKFYEVIMDMGGDVLEDITKLGDVTILAPSNEAWAAMNVQNVIRNRQKIREILNMHVIKDRLSTEKIRQKNDNQIAQVPTVNRKTFLYFNVKNENGAETITVEGGGVNATIIQSDIAQTNGFVHIIDKVLGVPYTTVLGKMETDPMLSDTYKMGIYSGFNAQLNNTQQRYTYFVVRNSGWEDFAIRHPSVHKKLFMLDYSYHSKAILERHLVIADQVYTMNDLVRMTNELGDPKEKIILPSYRDALNIRVTEELGQIRDGDGQVHDWPGYFIYWNFKRIPVYRPDVECVNGVIHVLDEPIVEEKDIVVSGSRGIYSKAQLPLGILTNFVITVMVAKLLLL